MTGPPTAASAATAGAASFVGTVATGGPLDWPCVTTSKPCPATFPGLVGVQFGPKGEPDIDVHPGGNRVTFSLATTACALATANGGEADKSPVEGGTCSLVLSGFVYGYCGLSEAMATGTLTGPIGGVGTTQSMPVLVELTDVGGLVVLSGQIGKSGDLGNLHGVGVMAAVPEAGVPPGNNCLAKSATRFTLAADVAVKILD
ncbi:MAG: hypothetical protein M3394_02120 [Actinomycetota bacterium]|nr:hypothetical protein [Actinomycetota bacterium]